MDSTKKPEVGYYYHYKHDPKGPVNNYAYKVIGMALHTEERTLTVVYRPLYKNTFLGEADFCNRPLDMFNEKVSVAGEMRNRFTRITDPKIIQELERIEKEIT